MNDPAALEVFGVTSPELLHLDEDAGHGIGSMDALVLWRSDAPNWQLKFVAEKDL